MTVAELLGKISAAFPAFNARAVEALAPVFRAQLEKHEGAPLREAWLAVAGNFVPGKSGLFPLPKHFEPYLPSGKLILPTDEDGPIRQAMKDQAERKAKNFDEWHRGQGAKIKANRPAPVYNACVLLAVRVAKVNGRLPLTAEQIKTCEDRALSQGRVAMFGALPRTNEAWTDQIEQVRASWTAPQQAAA